MIWYLMISYDSIAWYCMLLRCWLRCVGCVSQDAYILHNIYNYDDDDDVNDAHMVSTPPLYHGGYILCQLIHTTSIITNINIIKSLKIHLHLRFMPIDSHHLHHHQHQYYQELKNTFYANLFASTHHHQYQFY